MVQCGATSCSTDTIIPASSLLLFNNTKCYNDNNNDNDNKSGSPKTTQTAITIARCVSYLITHAKERKATTMPSSHFCTLDNN